VNRGSAGVTGIRSETQLKRWLASEGTAGVSYTKESEQAYHSESDVCLLERRSVIRAVACDSDNFTVRIEATVDDAFHQIVLVLW